MSAQLALDFGNTLCKAGVFRGRNLIHLETAAQFSLQRLVALIAEFSISDAIMSNVGTENKRLVSALETRTSFIPLTPGTRIPVTNRYKSPSTLGMDRLANVVGAVARFPDRNLLVISCGTCITYDLVTKDCVYHGGSITPGIDMRLKALNNFTARLPLVRKRKTTTLIGTNTEQAIRSGVMMGCVFEMDGFIRAYKKQMESLRIVMTGGDAPAFDTRLKRKIFAAPHLVLYGLNEILILNARLPV